MIRWPVRMTRQSMTNQSMTTQRHCAPARSAHTRRSGGGLDVTRAFACAWFAVALSVAGCGGSNRTLYDVSGTVTFDGQPVPAGSIIFEPDVAAGNDGTQGHAEIKDGQFDTAISQKGVTGGAYQARVRGYIPPQGDAPARVLFKDFRQELNLPAADSQQNINVPADAAAPTTEVVPDPT